MPNLTDFATVRDICARYDFATSKGFGQNFIVNAGIPPRMAEACGAGPDWGVLEIGPGIGVLTKELALRAKKVVALEVDKRLPPMPPPSPVRSKSFIPERLSGGGLRRDSESSSRNLRNNIHHFRRIHDQCAFQKRTVSQSIAADIERAVAETLRRNDILIRRIVPHRLAPCLKRQFF